MTADRHADKLQAASGNNGGNYCTLNPPKPDSNPEEWQPTKATALLVDLLERCRSGKFYWEFMPGNSYTMAGIESRTSPYAASYSGENNQQYALYGNNGSGQLYHNGSATSFDGFVSGDVIGVALDMDAGQVIYKNTMNSGNAAATNLTGAWTATAIAVALTTGTLFLT